MSITLANRIFQLTYISHFNSLKINIILFASNIFSYSSPLHFQWNHPFISPFECIRACTCLSNHSLFLRKHCQMVPKSLLLFRNHSISRNLTISISPSPHSFHYWWPSLQIVLTFVILLNVSKSILLSWVSMNIAFYVLKNGKIDVCWSEWSPNIPLKSQSEGYKIHHLKKFFFDKS